MRKKNTIFTYGYLVCLMFMLFVCPSESKERKILFHLKHKNRKCMRVIGNDEWMTENTVFIGATAENTNQHRHKASDTLAVKN